MGIGPDPSLPLVAAAPVAEAGEVADLGLEASRAQAMVVAVAAEDWRGASCRWGVVQLDVIFPLPHKPRAASTQRKTPVLTPTVG